MAEMEQNTTEAEFLRAAENLGIPEEEAIEMVDDVLYELYDPNRDNIEPSDADLSRAYRAVLRKLRAFDRRLVP